MHLLDFFSPMSRIKGKNIQALMVSDNIGNADFHVFSWYFAINSLFLLTKLNHLVPERKGQFVLLNRNKAEMALNSG